MLTMNTVHAAGSTVPATDMLKHGATTQSLLEKAGEKIGI